MMMTGSKEDYRERSVKEEREKRVAEKLRIIQKQKDIHREGNKLNNTP